MSLWDRYSPRSDPSFWKSVLVFRSKSILPLKPLYISLYILAMRWYICSTKGFEHTSRGNNAERAILGNPHSFRIAFFHVVLNWWMPLAFRVQAWHPYRWQHWAVNILDTTSRGADLKFAQTLLQPILQTDTTHTVVVTSPGLRQYRSY